MVKTLNSCKIRKLGVIVNLRRERAPAVLKELASLAIKHGLALFTDKSSASLLPNCICQSNKAFFSSIDALMVLGGDGTMLMAARELGLIDKPIIGVNTGRLGFLTSIAENELEFAIKCLVKGNYSTDLRAVASCRVVSASGKTSVFRALNDIVITRGSSVRVVTLNVSIDNDLGTSYICDGLIVCTPTGSTGHSLSAGGPILVPDADVFVINLICPHTLSSRPLVVPDNNEICVKVSSAHGETLLSVDGQVSQNLAPGDTVNVTRSKKSVRFIHLPGYSYFSVLRQKLGWSGSVISK